MVDKSVGGEALRGLEAGDVARRYQGILRMIAPGGWLRPPSHMQRSVALIATAMPGDSALVAENILSAAEIFAKRLPFWAGLRGDIRFCIGALITAYDADAEDVVALRADVRRTYKAMRAGYVEPYTFMAALIQAGSAERRGADPFRPAESALTRLHATTRILRQRHWFSYYHDVVPLVAVQTEALGAAPILADRVSRSAQQLRDAGFRSYADRLRAALILTAVGQDVSALIRLMEDWRQALKSQPVPHRRIGVVDLALLTVGWGRADRDGLDELARLHGALRHGRPKADPSTAITYAAALLARMGASRSSTDRGAASGAVRPQTGFPVMALLNAHAASAAAAEESDASEEEET